MPIAILIAAQRTGTHYLRNLLHSHDRVQADLEEIFHDSPEALARADNFWNFLRLRSHDGGDPWMPWHRGRMFREFLDVAEARYPGKTLVIDIKYNSLHHASGTWQTAGGEPEALIHLRKWDFPVVHLRRRNILKMVVSAMRATAAGQHVVLHSETNLTRPLRIDCRDVRHWVDAFRAEADFVTKMLAHSPRVHTVWYEDLWEDLPGGTRNARTEAALLDHLGLAGTLLPDASVTKMTPDDLQDAVENFDELRGLYAGTDDAWMLG